MRLDELLSAARDGLTVRRVFAEPFAQDGTTVIAAASVVGGGGGGGGRDQQGQEGEGGGLGLIARPAGAYVIKDGTVRWVPAVDVNRAIAAIAALALVVVITRARTQRARILAGL